MNPRNITKHPKKGVSSHNFLIVGYGDESKGDYGVGPAIARVIQFWNIPGVTGIAHQQLTSALCRELSTAEFTIFVTAHPATRSEQIQVYPLTTPAVIQKNQPMPVIGQDPTALLTLTNVLYGVHPQAWQIEAPATRFDKEYTLSETAKQGLSNALGKIEIFVRSYQLLPSYGHSIVAGSYAGGIKAS